jgi:HPt (histidine-containing phosphotransfer) domain-containing protein
MNDYVAKPLRQGILQEVLEHWLPSLPVPNATVASSEAKRRPAGDSSGLREPERHVFDPEDLLERLMGNAAIARRALARFLSEVPTQLRELSLALSHADREQICLVAHAMKGAAGNVSAGQLRQLAQKTQSLAEAGELTAVGELLPEIEGCFERFRGMAEKFQSEIATSD